MARNRVARPKVTEEIVRAIEHRITRGELKLGDRLPPERGLARELGASRGSVREALRALEVAGVIQSRHGGGSFVVGARDTSAMVPLGAFLDRQRANLVDLFEARRLLEPRLASLAAERASRENLESLRTALERHESCTARGDLDAAAAADRVFHQAIAEATHNQTSVMIQNYLSDLVLGIRRDAVETEARRRQAVVDHRAIYRAIGRRDGPGASAAMSQHIKNVEALLLEALAAYRGAITHLPARRTSRREVA
ncbi:MAG: FadR family transcriptional regulator [Gemmatimonadetes bacterium]|nr:FadR family transcriptional regulator [Gemmatimonadota bacterium]